MKRLFLTFLALIFILKGFSQINYSNTERLTEGWLYLQGDIGNIWEAVRPVKPGGPETVPLWSAVTLPHCFNATDAVAPDINYYQGPGWYKTLLEVNNPHPDGRILLHFEGAGQKSEVYVYMEKVGTHVGGYDEWSVDITDAVNRFMQTKDAERFKGKIPVSVRCDNSRDAEMHPSDLSDFNVYGGLYRYVNLVYTPAWSITGVYVDARVDNKGRKGELRLTGYFDNLSDVKSGTIQLVVYDPAGKQIKETVFAIDTKNEVSLLNFTIDRPVLWSPDNPALYHCEITLTSPAGTMTCKEEFGFRHFEFAEKGPFLLNGKRLLLRGTHRHEDHAGVAAAMTEEQIWQEMKLMKEMGVNFIRLGHYQQSRIVLEACDRLGIMAWEEIPWCRGGLGGEVYQEQGRRMLTNMIIQHRNHPCVILWGLGNENDWPNDFPEFDKEKIRVYMKQLHDLSHQLDDSRLTAIRRCDFCNDIPDVYSPTIWAGWYRGVYTDYQRASYTEMQKVKHFLHVEWGGDSHARRYAEKSSIDPRYMGKRATIVNTVPEGSPYTDTIPASRNGDWSESYIVDLIDWHLKEQENMSWLTGTAYWPFKDFSTPLRPENPVPYVNQKGVVERDLTPKEAFYVFQSYWTEKPMIHIYGSTWPVRWGKAEEEKMLKVYSNCDEVEMWLNGKSLGKKKRDSQNFPAAGLRWESVLQPGKNLIAVTGWKGKGKDRVTITDELEFEYEIRSFDMPAKIEVTKLEDTPESVWIEARLVDKNGVTALESADYIYFELAGDGELIKDQGTSTGSSTLQAYNGRAKIKVVKSNGSSVVAVRSKGLKTEFIKID